MYRRENDIGILIDSYVNRSIGMEIFTCVCVSVAMYPYIWGGKHGMTVFVSIRVAGMEEGRRVRRILKTHTKLVFPLRELWICGSWRVFG